MLCITGYNLTGLLWKFTRRGHFYPKNKSEEVTGKNLRDCRQISFVTLNGFCPLSKKKPTPPVLNRKNQYGVPTK